MPEIGHQGSGEQGRGLQVEPGAGQHEAVVVGNADVLLCKDQSIEATEEQ